MSRQVSIRVGAERPGVVRAERARMVLCAVGPMAWADPGTQFRPFVVAERGNRDTGPHIAHLRLPPSARRELLPGLAGAPGSRLRDALTLAHAGGVDAVDVMIARAPGLTPWDLASPAAVGLLEPMLESVPGTVVCFPDASGPSPRGRMVPPPGVRLASLVMSVRRYAQAIADQWQTLVVDLPRVDSDLLYRALEDLDGSDAALVAWRGDERAIAKHGFRPGSALVASLLASSRMPSDSLVGRKVALPGGRPAPAMRLHDLGVPVDRIGVPDVADRATVPLSLDARGAVAEVVSEPSLRRPAGTWSLPMLRTAKLVHHRIVVASNAFTFREANEEQALILQAALLEALADLERRGIIGGNGPGDRIEVQTAPYRNPAQPALVASVTVFLRPWLQRVHVDLTLRPSGVSLEVT